MFFGVIFWALGLEFLEAGLGEGVGVEKKLVMVFFGVVRFLLKSSPLVEEGVFGVVLVLAMVKEESVNLAYRLKVGWRARGCQTW